MYLTLIVSVVFNLPIKEPLPYLVPEKLKERIQLFARVAVPLRDQKIVGLVTAVFDDEEWRSQQQKLRLTDLKEVSRLVDGEAIINQQQFELARQVAEYYVSSLGEALFTMIPSGRRETRAEINELLQSPLDQGLPELLPGQKKIVEEVLAATREKVGVHLLFGITGSGKTRVYIELIQKYLQQGLGAIFLLPEIALSYQFLDQLKPIFGESMAILHSGLGRSHRLREYKRVLRGEARLVVGTRSAVFAPVENLSLIIIDEEHDGSYKEHAAPRYHGKKIAHMRLQVATAQGLPLSLLLGTATPAIESYYWARRGGMSLHRLEQRATGHSLPEVHVPLHDAFDHQQGIFSLFLKDKMKEHIDAGNQALLLLNRRGHSNYAFCRDCQEAVGCPHCSVSLTYHRADKQAADAPFLKCHLCGFSQPYHAYCPTCHQPLKLMGKGTQKVEDALEKHFPGVVYARLDQDTAGLKGYSQEIISATREQKIQVLIGTQMIAKGFDLPGVTLVGIINADIGLGLPDFRSPERVFQLLTQASGRAGRHQQGEVVIQTVQPKHYAIYTATRADYLSFADQEFRIRKEMNFPPFTRLLRFLFKSTDERDLLEYADKVAAFIKFVNEDSGLFGDMIEKPSEIFGPMEAPIYKIQDKFRMHVIAKDRDANLLSRFARLLNAEAAKIRIGSVSYEVDVDPVDLL